MRITAVEGSLATIAAAGLEQRCSIMLVPDARVGDYVLVHAGFALNVIDEAEAHETYDLLREIGGLGDVEPGDATPGGAGLDLPGDADGGG